MTKEEIKKKLEELVNKAFDYESPLSAFFRYSGNQVDIHKIPELLALMNEMSTLIYMIPNSGNWEDRWSHVGYNDTLPENTTIPLDLLPRYNHKGTEYPYNAGYNAYALFIRDFTHDLRGSFWKLNDLYKNHITHEEEYPRSFMQNYLDWLRPFYECFVRCVDHLIKGDEYADDVMYVSKYNDWEKMYKIYRFWFQEVTWEDKKAYTYIPPVLQHTQSTFIWKTTNSFLKV